jgi:hypothetical protein
MSLFKYVSRKRIDILTEGIIRFTQPSAFNDPFEALPSFKCLVEGGLLNKLLDRYFTPFESTNKGIIEDGKILSLQEVKRFKRQLALKNKTEEIQIMRDFVQGMKNNLLDIKFGMLSLSRNPNSLLMWAHYSDDHKGMLIEFDEEHSFFKRGFKLSPIVYSSNRTKEAFMVGDSIDLDSMLYRKSSEWAYEQEWRLVAPLASAKRKVKSKPFDLYLFGVPVKAIKAITLGCRSTKNTEKNLLTGLAKRRGTRHIRVYRASIHDNAFALEYVPIAP